MPEVDDFNPGGLEDTAHDVDGGVVAIEQRGSGDETDLAAGLVMRGLTSWGLSHGGPPCTGEGNESGLETRCQIDLTAGRTSGKVR